MKKQPGRYLTFYYKFMDRGVIPNFGLCNVFDNGLDNDLFELLKPTPEDKAEIISEGLSTSAWGSGLPTPSDVDGLLTKFTPLRQNIVLLMAALNNEL
jgi:hypothetical protein